MTDLLTRAAAAVQHHPDAGRPDLDAIERRVSRRRARRRTAAVIGAAAVLVPGSLTVARSMTHRSIVTASGTIDAGGLRMGGTAGDFYDLDPSVVPAGWLRVLDEDVIKLGVCTAVEDDADGPLCTETEGPGHPGVSQVRYAPVGASADLKGGTTGTSLEVQTMHTSPAFDLNPYVAQFAVAKGARSVASRTVRGHDARSYDGNGPNTPTLTWQEQPGLIVSVSGNNLDLALVAAAAEAIDLVDVERLPMPTVVARVDDVSWTGGDNNHPYLLAVKRDGKECVGWAFIDGCSQRPADWVHIEFASSSYWTMGAVPADVINVDVLGTGGVALGSHDTYAVPGFSSKFFSVPSPADRPPYTMTLHHADGHIDSIFLGYAPLRPSTLPATIDGVSVTTAIEGASDNGMPYRVLSVPARTARSAAGGNVAIPRCVVLETSATNATWCGEVTAPVAVASDDIVLVVTPPGWTTDPSFGGMQVSDNVGTDPGWANAVVVTADQRVFATAPGGTRTEVPTPVAAQPMPTFADVTARLTAG